MFKVASLKDNECVLWIKFIFGEHRQNEAVMGRVKGWISNDAHHIDKAKPQLCQSAILVYGTNRDPKPHLCHWTSLQARHQSHNDCPCSFRRNKSPFHLTVLPNFAPKAHMDMLTSLGCSYEMWYECSIRIRSQKSKAWIPTGERIGRELIQKNTSGFVLGSIQPHADTMVNPQPLQNCFI